jgi:hypothetical protein
MGFRALRDNTSGSTNTALGFNSQSGNFSGSTILGAGATASSNNQFVLGSAGTPIGPVVSETKTINRTLEINLNGNLYKLLMYKA